MNWSARVCQTSIEACSSLGPYESRRRAASSALKPSREVSKASTTESSRFVCHPRLHGERSRNISLPAMMRRMAFPWRSTNPTVHSRWSGFSIRLSSLGVARGPLRLWIPGHFREARAAYEWAWKQEFANPLRPSTADELRWYFGQRRGRHSAAHDDHERDLKRYAQARRAFSAPRYRVLYRAWLREGGRVIDATSSPALADAITRGAGRFEAHVLARPYLHLSSLL